VGPRRTAGHGLCTIPERQDLHDAMLILPLRRNPRLPSQGPALVWSGPQARFDLGQ